MATDRTCTSPDAGITRVFQVLGKRWTGLILAALMNGPGHFTELRRAVPGISERMLSDRLSELGELSLVVREVDEGPPLRVRYLLTDAGHALRPAMQELTRWADGHLREGGRNCPNAFQPGHRVPAAAGAGGAAETVEEGVAPGAGPGVAPGVAAD